MRQATVGSWLCLLRRCRWARAPSGTGALAIFQDAGRGDISAEQLRRFRERIETPTKHWKISPDDNRNRERRRDYLAALDDMARTSTADVPWHVVPAEYKWFARVAVAKTAVKALGKGITLGPPPLAPEVVKAATEILGRKDLAALGLSEPGQASREVCADK